MRKVPAVIEAHIAAYNRKDVAGMLACLSDTVTFRNISDGEVTAEAGDKQSFAKIAEFGATALRSRHQSVTNAITVADTTLVDVDYTAVVAIDLPNGWTEGQELAFTGASMFRVAGDLIVDIVDES